MTRARDTDMTESHDAAARIRPYVTTLQNIVLDYIRDVGTSRDIFMVKDLMRKHGHRESTWRTRRKELVDKGLVEKCGSDGKHSIWRIKVAK
jgi:hypothetical protein